MSTRVQNRGRLIDRGAPLGFTFNGARLKGYEGDTLASALLANDRILVGRSFKYHRPRGMVASGAEEPNALMSIGTGGRFEPNRCATSAELFDGLVCRSQNHWPTLGFDVGALSDAMSRFLPAGFYYKTFIHPRAAWKHVFEPFIRHAAGLGRPPRERDADRYEHVYAFADVLVIGGGIAGLMVARVAGEAGAKVLLIEQTAHWGGRTLVDGARIDGQCAEEWVKKTVQYIEKAKDVSIRTRTAGMGVYDHGYVIAHERVADCTPGDGRPRHRLWRIRATRIVTATGAIERPISFAGNDVPGVMLASAIRDYLVNWGVSAGDRTAVVTNNDDAYRTAITLREAGLDVPAVLDARPEANGPLPARARELGIRITTGAGIAGVKGRGRVTGVAVCQHAGEGHVLEEIDCEAVAMSGGWSPAVHLWSHCGGKLDWDTENAFFRPNLAHPPAGDDGAGFMIPAGSANGALTVADVLADAHRAGEAAARVVGFAPDAIATPEVEQERFEPILPVWIMPNGAGPEMCTKMWLDYQNDVKVSDVQLAAREGYESVEHAKRYTTLGMATDQGKISNINGLAVLSSALDQEIPVTGVTTFRPPYTPIPMGAVAGEARGELFQPLRKTPIDGWHDENGADWEPVGHWRRPYCYRRGAENRGEAVHREVTNARAKLGILDASTLGKLLVKGPDAGRFLDMLYTGLMSALKPGKCRYGLMCSENGFLIDDGVVARVGEETFLCHTTTGGADRIHGWMEEWLQTEWWDMRVHVANLTEQFAQIAVAGPNARKILEKLGGMDVSREALGFMDWRDGQLGGFDARVYRISFSGELSYEIAVPAGRGRALWDALLDAGAEFGAMPYGTECLHVMRAEKGFIMIGDETDGTVIPQDLGLDWAISKKKEEYLGKRAQERAHMTDPDRWKLVGLETLDGSVLPDGAYVIGKGVNANGQRNTEGRVTSTYFSPTLGKGIAMGLVRRGPERIGETIRLGRTDGTEVKARIVDTVWYDKDGRKQNV